MHAMTSYVIAAFVVAAAAAGSLFAAENAPTAPPAPGPRLNLPEVPAGRDGPQIFAQTAEAGPDQSFLLVGENLTEDVRLVGPDDDSADGSSFAPRVQYVKDGRYLCATVPQGRYDGVLVGRVVSEKGASRPFVLNAPQAWWVSPASAEPGEEIAVYGRNLARRPDGDQAYLYMQRMPDAPAVPLDVIAFDKFRIRARLPGDAAPGEVTLRAHTGAGGEFGWSGSLKLTVVKPAGEPRRIAIETATADALAKAISDAAEAAPAIVELPEGAIDLHRTLRLPAGVTLRGRGRDRSILRFNVSDDEDAYLLRTGGGWNYSPHHGYSKGESLQWALDVPAAGEYVVWARYACDQSWWKKPGVSGVFTLSEDNGRTVTLENLPNTGGYGWYRWSKVGTLRIDEGHRVLTLRNTKGGGMALDALVFALDEDFTPSDDPFPADSNRLIVVQAENVTEEYSRFVRIPGREHVAVQLAGDGAALESVSVRACAATDTGILVQHEQFPRWAAGCAIRDVELTGVEGKRSENRSVHLRYAQDCDVTGSELWGRSVYLSGARQCRLTGNRVVPRTRHGRNATAAIQSRTNTLEECVIADNVIAAPPGMGGGTGTAQRMIWLSTGHGSVSKNYIARNTPEEMHFNSVAGTTGSRTDNVGETILFEACQRYCFFGRPAAVGETSLTLPQTVPPTPDDQLGTVPRAALPHDANGNEIPVLPPLPEEDDGVFEPPTDQYYVLVVDGPGMLQTRRVVGRDGHALKLDRPWRVAPTTDSRVVVTTLFYRNLVVDNEPVNGMSGIQLWFGCVENVVSGNTVAHHRRQGLSLWGRCSTLASSMPRMWNRGLAPCYFNTWEGNRVTDTTHGGYVNGGASRKLTCDFPLVAGTVFRHNSLLDNRSSGMRVSGDGSAAAPGAVGTIVEFNLVRNTPSAAYHVGRDTDGTLIRRNHALFWTPPGERLGEHVVTLVDSPGTTVVTENDTEASHPGPSRVRMEAASEDYESKTENDK